MRSDVEAANRPGELWSHAFRVSSILVDGEPQQIVEGSPMYLNIGTKGRRIAWIGGCNGLSAELEIERDQLVVDEASMSSTVIGCAPLIENQERWFSEFLIADPTWSLVGDRLLLSDDRATIEFDRSEGHCAEGAHLNLCPTQP